MREDFFGNTANVRSKLQQPLRDFTDGFCIWEKKKSHSSPSCRKKKALYSSRQQCHPQNHQAENLYVMNNNRDVPWADPCPQNRLSPQCRKSLPGLELPLQQQCSRWIQGDGLLQQQQLGKARSWILDPHQQYPLQREWEIESTKKNQKNRGGEREKE